jgi:hypothetical protein
VFNLDIHIPPESCGNLTDNDIKANGIHDSKDSKDSTPPTPQSETNVSSEEFRV